MALAMNHQGATKGLQDIAKAATPSTAPSAAPSTSSFSSRRGARLFGPIFWTLVGSLVLSNIQRSIVIPTWEFSAASDDFTNPVTALHDGGTRHLSETTTEEEDESLSEPQALALFDVEDKSRLQSDTLADQERVDPATSSGVTLPSDDNNQRADLRNASKPLLIVHVGPLKTGTTSIQFGLLHNPNFVRKLAKDGYQVANHCYFEKLDRQWPLWEKEAERRQRRQPAKSNLGTIAEQSNVSAHWEGLLTEYDNARNRRNNGTVSHVVHSCESLSEMPRDANVALPRLRALSEDWQVKIVLMYRPVYDWIPSRYAELQRKRMWSNRKNKPMAFPSRRELPGLVMDTFPSFLDGVFPNQIYDSLATRDLFASVFGPENVLVLPMIPPNARKTLEEAFACRGLVNATHACKHSRQVRKQVWNKSSKLMIDHDLIAVEAYRQKYISNPRETHDKHRHNITLAIQAQLDQWNMTISDMPQTCVSPAMQDWLWNRTLISEREMAMFPMSKDKLYQLFLAKRHKFCSVNATAVLQNATWTNFFTKLNLAYRREYKQIVKQRIKDQVNAAAENRGR